MLKIFAILVALTPGQEPDKQVAFLTPEGIQMCWLLADTMNKVQAETKYTCELFK